MPVIPGSDLQERLLLAENEVRQYEMKYGVTLNQLEIEGLPDNADFAWHEDYVMWRHWTDAAEKARQKILSQEDA